MGDYFDSIREEQLKQYHDLLIKRDENQADVLSIAGVIAMSVGMKVVDSVPTDVLCFRIYVEKKKPEDEIPASEIIPEFIDNVPTDVEELTADVTASSDDERKYRPLCGGIRICSADSGHYGTLGCLAINKGDEISDGIYLLTNYHVLMANGEEKDHQVGQPDFCCDSCCCRCGEIARIEKWANWNDNVDCAIARLTNGAENSWTNEILELGPICCIQLDWETDDPVHPVTTNVMGLNDIPYRAVLPKDTVFKRGIASGITEGIVVDPTAPVNVLFTMKDGKLSKRFINQILIYKKDTSVVSFTKKGDSGAVIVNHLNEIVGLHFADNEIRDNNGSIQNLATKSYANPIQDVIKILKITIPRLDFLDEEFGWRYPETLPIRSPSENFSIQPTDFLGELTKKVETFPEGYNMIGIFKKHRKEIMDLIKNDRETKVKWNRNHGPSFAAQLMQKVKDPAYQVQTTIENVSYRDLLTRMALVLQKKGSPAVINDVSNYSAKAIAIIENLINSSNVEI